MRPGQKNRMRGGRSSGNNNNSSRRGPNPLTRSYESNGPDVKVRGTPQHIAEKYMQLARDANSSGDNVMAEAYLQHAEHYYRIIAAAQNAQQIAYNQANGIASPSDITAVDDEDEFEVAGSDRFTFRTPQSFQAPTGQNGGAQPFSESGEQPPMIEGQPMNEGGQPSYQPQQQPRHDRGNYERGNQERGDRQFGNRRPQFEDRGDRPDRGDRQLGDRQPGDRQPGDRQQGERPQFDRPAGERQQNDRPDRNNRRFGRDRQFGDRNFADRPGYIPRDNRDGQGTAVDAGQDQPSLERPVQERPVQERLVQERPSMDQVQPGLPSFITAPVRPVTVDANDAPAVDVGGKDDAAPLRRRRRTRAEIDAANAASED